MKPTHPGTPGKHIRAQRKANALLVRGYRLQDQFGRWLKSAHKRKNLSYFKQIKKLQAKWDLKIGPVDEEPEEFKEPGYAWEMAPVEKYEPLKGGRWDISNAPDK